MTYHNSSALAGVAGVGSVAALATTGPAGWLWMALAAFALIAAGTALLRIIPRRERQRQ